MSVIRHYGPLLTLYFAEQVLTKAYLKEHLYITFFANYFFNYTAVC